MAAVEQDNMDREERICNLCDTKTDSELATCVNCNIQMCGICTKAHTRMKLTKDHRITYDGRTTLTPSQHGKICSTHSGEHVTFYCFSCNRLICPHCITSSHNGHKCSVIKTVTQEISEKLTAGLEKFKATKLTAIKSKIVEVEHLLNENNDVARLNTENIEKRRDELLDTVQRIAETFLNTNTTATGENGKQLAKIYVSLKNEFTEMERLYKEHAISFTSGSDLKVIMAFNTIQLALEMNDNPSVNEPNISFNKFLPGNTKWCSFLNILFGSLESEEETSCDFESDEEEEQTSETDDTATREEETGCDFESDEEQTPTKAPENVLTEEMPKDSHDSLPIRVAEIQYTPKVNINVKILSKFNHLGLAIPCMFPFAQNKVLVFSKNSYHYYFLNMKGRVLNKYKQDFIIQDCSSSGDKAILVTDVENKNISKISLKGELVSDINLALLYPLCLCKSMAGNILVTVCDERTYEIKDDSKRMVMRIEFTGKVIETYEYHNGQRLFTKAIGIHENINGDICVIDRYSVAVGSLVVLNKKGEFKYRYRGGSYQIKFDPIRVKCDIHGHIIVSDKWENKIHLISMTGELVQYLMTKSELKHKPLSLAPCKSGLLWIGCWDGRMYLIKYLDQ